MELYILTGASRGLGAALAQRLLAPGRRLLTLARTPAAALAQQARALAAPLEQWTIDLADAPAAATRLADWLRPQSGADYTCATLINNAGLLGPVGPVDQSDYADLAAVMRVDLEAPMLLTAAFLRGTSGWRAARRVLNISSGAGSKAYAGWAGYCAAKAGLDHFTRAVALDEQRHPNGARIVSLAPGVIDTDMQTALRAADDSGFPDKPRFVAMKAAGQLAGPDEAAARVLAYLERPNFGAEPVADVRSAQ
jgi:benzil reductase ((S)-benzoin forming)